jgi:hypothetical protein
MHARCTSDASAAPPDAPVCSSQGAAGNWREQAHASAGPAGGSAVCQSPTTYGRSVSLQRLNQELESSPMGWLRHLMSTADPPYKSYGALARDALAHPGWPDHTRTQARSLASIFSKLDRGVDPEWLADRDAVQRVLAELLSCGIGEIKASVDSGTSTSIGSRRLRLDDVRYATAIDLTDEPLCPGIPPAVLNPSAWHTTWWVAPSGSGRSLVGRWLEARGLATFVSVASWNQARTRLPTRGHVFVELTQPRPGDPPADLRDRSLCVAASCAPPPEGFGAWSRVESPPVETYLDRLVEWVSARLPGDGHFDAAFAKQWLRTGPVAAAKLVDRLGSVLGLCGLIDEAGPRWLRGRRLEELARRYFEARVTAVAERTDVTWVKRSGFDLLLGLFRRILTDSDQPWFVTRTQEAWLDLVPLEHRQGADVEWLRLSLLDGRSPVRPADIDRAARRLPPGAYRAIQALRAARLLVAPHGGDALGLRPQWFARLMAELAQRSLLEGSPFEWGEALLRPHAASDVERALTTRLQDGDTEPLTAVLEIDADDSPAQVAALEATFRGVGLALLNGTELSCEALEGLWDEQVRLLVELPDRLPQPRIGSPEDHTRPERYAAWLAGALCVTEQLEPGLGARHRLLRPWQDSSPPAGLGQVLDRIHAGLVAGEPGWATGAFALVDRLRSAIGSVGETSPHPLERPGVVLEELVHGVLEWDSVAGMESQRLELDALRRLATARGYEWPEVAASIWRAWQVAGGPLSGAPLLAPAGALAEWFWPHVPPPTIERAFSVLVDEGAPIVCTEWRTDQWEAWISAIPRLGARAQSSTELWEAVPADRLEAALGQVAALPPETWQVLWRRSSDAVVRLFDTWLGTDQLDLALSLLASTPRTHTLALLPSLSRCLPNAPAAVLDPVRSWLAERVTCRTPDWRAAYALLASVEKDLGRTRTRMGDDQ